MIKHFSPRAWLNSLYSNQNFNSDALKIGDTGKAVRSSSKHIKGMLPSKSSDELKRSNTVGLKVNKGKLSKRVDQIVEKKAFQCFNQRVQIGLFDNFQDVQGVSSKTETSKMRKKQDIVMKRLPQCKQVIQSQQRPMRRVKLSIQYPHKVQIVLTEDNNHSTPEFTPNRIKIKTINDQQIEHQVQKQIKSIRVTHNASLAYKNEKISQNLQVIHEETSEYNRGTSQSTFRTPQQLSEHLLISRNCSQQKMTTLQKQEDQQYNQQQQQQLLIDSDVNSSPIKNYKSSVSIANPEFYQRIQTEEAQTKKQFLISELKQMYLQQFERNEFSQQNLTASIQRQLQTGVKIHQRLITNSNDYTTSLDRLSPIPLDDSQKQYRQYTMQSCNSVGKEEHQESIIKLIKVQKQMHQTLSDFLAMTNHPVELAKSIKKLKVFRKQGRSLISSIYTTQQIHQQRVDFGSRINIQTPVCNYCSLRTNSNQNEYQTTPISSIKTSYQYQSGRLTDRSRKGLSLSKKSEEKVKRQSVEKSPVNQKKSFLKISKLKGDKKCKQYVRLGNKIMITLAQQRRPGIRVISEQKRRSKSRCIKRKVI